MKTLALLLPVLFPLVASAASLPVPYADKDHSSWEDECGKPKKIFAPKTLPIYSSFSKGKDLGLLKKNETAEPLTSFDIVTKTAQLKVLKSHRGFKRGETVELLSMGPDSSYRLYHDGKIVTDKHDEEQDLRFESPPSGADAPPHYEMWVRIKYGGGKIGWIQPDMPSCEMMINDSTGTSGEK